jgi:hypothetical protein
MKNSCAFEKEGSWSNVDESNKKKHRVKPERGWYLLEYGVVLFGVAVFIVGIADVSRIFHARGAVRAGVTEGLRCLYTTDANCGGASIGSGSLSGALFNARINGGDLSGNYELPRVSYQLATGWFNENVYQAEFATKKLTQVTLTQPQDAYRKYQVLFPAVANAAYLLKSRELPLVTTGSGATPAERILSPKFINPETGDSRGADKIVSAPTLTMNSKNFSAGVVASEISRSFTVGLSDIFPSSNDWSSLKNLEASNNFRARCYQGPKISLPDGRLGIAWPQSGAPLNCAYRSSLEEIYNGTQMRVPLVLHVAGAGYINSSKRWPEWRGVFGQVELELWQSGKLLASLGGREFQRTNPSSRSDFDKQWGNFVTRGVGANSQGNFDVTQAYVDACKASDYDTGECKNYISLPLITVGTPVTLKFKIKWRSSGAMTRPDVNITWNGGDVQIFYPSFRAVHEQRDCGYSESPHTCSISPAPLQVSYIKTDLATPLSFSESKESQCGRVEPQGYHAAIPKALEDFSRELQSGERSWGQISFWSHGNVADKCDDKKIDAPCTEKPVEYLKGCEPKYALPDDAISRCELKDYQPARDTISNPRFIFGASDRTETRGGCTGEPFPECARDNLSTKGQAFIGQTSSGCAAALPVNIPQMDTQPLFKDSCVDPLPELVKRYKERYKVPEGVSVLTRVKDEAPVITSEPPTNSCWESREIKQGDSKSWMCAEGASRFVANRCCEKYGRERCTLEQINSGQGGSVGDSYERLANGAIERAYTTVQAAYPPARMDAACGGLKGDGTPGQNNCVMIQAGPDGEGDKATVQASMQVPLSLFDWLGLGGNTVVSHRETRVLERALVGQG